MSCSNDVQKMKSVEIGMSRDQVIQIVGEPGRIKETVFEGVPLIYLYYDPPVVNASTIPRITLCKETGLVVEVLIDYDNPKLNKKANSYDLCTSPQTNSN